jgi:hypothetical protein
MVTTFRIQSDKILIAYYRGIQNQSATFTVQFVSQLISEEMAALAFENAVNNSRAGETFYTNDTFIATFPNIAVQYDSVLKQQYIPLPSLPTALPSNQEIQKVWPVGSRKIEIPYIANRSTFSQNLLPPMRGYILCYGENGNLVFDNPTAFSITAVNVNLVGAMPDGNLLDATLLLPKNMEALLSERVIARLLATSSRPRDIKNDGVSIPS